MFLFEYFAHWSSTKTNGTAATTPQNIPSEVTGAEGESETKETNVTHETLDVLDTSAVVEVRRNNLSRDIQVPKSMLLRSPSIFLPMIRRGFRGDESDTEEKDVMAVGWKVEVTNRKEREEALRDKVHRFEVKIKQFYSTMEQGFEVIMWQMNLINESGVNKNSFTLKSTPVQIKLHRHGNLLVQAALTFTMKGGYLSKALNRRRVDRSALEPLPLHEILQVKAGCHGYDHMELPVWGKAKGSENKHIRLFLTITASPTPMSSSRIYYLKFMSRSARNDLLMGLRCFLADLQIHEGISISSFHMHTDSIRHDKCTSNGKPAEKSINIPNPLQSKNDVMIPLSEVHRAFDKEMEAYDRVLLMLLQGACDLEEKEDDMLALKDRLDIAVSGSQEKDKIQENDSNLIMQLSKKVETLLMGNEDLRDENERLNNRLVAVESEKMNLMCR